MVRIPRLRAPLGGFITLLLLAGASGCSLVDPEFCHAGIFYEVDPDEATLEPGESFTPTAAMVSCRNRQEIALRWSADDPEIVEVDTESGRTTGLRAGETHVRGRAEDDTPLVSIRVTVEAAP